MLTDPAKTFKWADKYLCKSDSPTPENFEVFSKHEKKATIFPDSDIESWHASLAHFQHFLPTLQNFHSKYVDSKQVCLSAGCNSNSCRFTTSQAFALFVTSFSLIAYWSCGNFFQFINNIFGPIGLRLTHHLNHCSCSLTFEIIIKNPLQQLRFIAFRV